MSESENVKKSPSKLVILLIVIIVLVAGGVVTALLLLLNQGGDTEDGEPARTIGYQEGYIILDEKDAENVLDAPEGMINLNYKNVAESADGVNFICEINNSDGNSYDMYLDLYLDATFEDELFLSGLIPPGGGIETFKSDIPLEDGYYEAVLVMTQVDDDHATIVGQASVVINLYVHGEYEYETEETLPTPDI